MSLGESKKVVLQLFEAMEKRDPKTISELLTEDASWWVIGSIPNVSGTYNKQGLLDLLAYLLPAIGAAPKMVVDHIIEDGNYVAAEAHSEGKSLKGKNYENRYHFKFEVKNDKIIRVREYNDTDFLKTYLSGK